MNFIDWDSFHFLRPDWLWSALALVPILWLAWKQQATAGAWHRVCDRHLLQHLIVGEDGRARRWPLAVFAAGWVATSAALAGPAWRKLPQPAFDDPTSTVLVLDLSSSMDEPVGDDRSGPSRLARARFKAHDVVELHAGGRTGLVVFGEDPYPVMPLTDDPAVVADALPILSTDLMPGHGKRLGLAIDEARGLLEQAGAADGSILVLADGAGEDPADARRAAEDAAGAGFRVSAIGVGPEPSALASIAQAGEGGYSLVTADDADVAEVLPRETAARLSFGEAKETASKFDVWEDMGVWLVLIPLLLASLAFRRGWSGGAPAFLCLGAIGGGDGRVLHSAEWFQRADQRAQVAFEDGRHGDAAELFEDARWKAASLYRDGQYEEAAGLLRGLPDVESRYNLGNALARHGKLEEAIAAYDEALEGDPEHADAQFNRDLVKRLLDEQEQEPEQESEDEQQQQSGQQPSEEEQEQRSQQEPSQPQAQSQGPDEQGPGQQGQPQQCQPQQGQPQQPAADQQPQDSASQGAPSEPENATEPSDSPQPGEHREAEYDEVADGRVDESEAPTHDEATPPHPTRVDDGEPTSDEPPVGRFDSAHDREMTEEDQQVEQWLGRIPDDPAGLLRAKIRRRYLERRIGRQ